MYELTELKDGERFKGVEITSNGRTVCELCGGISLVIAAQWAAMNGWEAKTQQAFLNGIVLAMSHCAITGKVPVAMVG